jgi:hypothetical protein
LPSQVKDEFNRNREGKIADAMRGLKDQRLNLQFPQLCKEYEEYYRLRDLQRRYQKEHTRLLERVNSDVEGSTLKADDVITELFRYARDLEIDNAVINQARERVDRGNPPGKRGSLGDAINWEVLLQATPNGEDLFLISDDKDFASPIDPERLNNFLYAEWHTRKNSEVKFYKRLSEFFRDQFPEIRLASELEKDLLIRDLANSGTFIKTHSIVARLSSFEEFIIAQRNAIVDAAITNNQVSWIISDPDIRSFLLHVIDGHKQDLNQESLVELQALLTPPETDSPCEREEDDLPF